jgi:transposase InsO family protein
MAVAVRGGREVIAGVVLHTDQGSEYTARSFRAACTRCGIRQSMGRPGSALDNAVIESWHSTVEFELRRIELNRPGSARGSGSGHLAPLGDGVSIHDFAFNRCHVVD